MVDTGRLGIILGRFELFESFQTVSDCFEILGLGLFWAVLNFHDLFRTVSKQLHTVPYRCRLLRLLRLFPTVPDCFGTVSDNSGRFGIIQGSFKLLELYQTVSKQFQTVLYHFKLFRTVPDGFGPVLNSFRPVWTSFGTLVENSALSLIVWGDFVSTVLKLFQRFRTFESVSNTFKRFWAVSGQS